MHTISLSFPDLIDIFLLMSTSFLVAIVLTPFWTNVLYTYKLGKRIRDTDVLGKKAPIFYKFHKDKEHVPTLGGVLIWVTTTIMMAGISLAAVLFVHPSINYLSMGSVKLLVFTLVATGIIGGLDDLLNIFGIGPHRGGFGFWTKFPLYLIVALAGAWWFSVKLEWLNRPFSLLGFGHALTLHWWYVPLFIIVLVYMAFATDITDGLDGLAGGLLVIAYLAYAVIALVQGNAPIAAFCAVVVGALLAFLWFNIYPARFIMGDTGSMSLGMTLAVMAFLTNTVVALPIIAAVIVLDGASSPLQIISKRVFKRKIFMAAPVHHHFQGVGWPEPKIVMRFWVLGAVFAVIGLAVALFGRI